ncbi:hypothetical protein ACHAWO_004427 [Cyclotella atomus]|uniref:Homeobox domain-containing protein n=1 Tax=Cyclotella atomus TaxID=382360 RepID=A0ABD3P6F1_9STRA
MSTNPTLYPTEEEKAQLALATGRTCKQVEKWFFNARHKKMKFVPPSAADALEKWINEHPLDPPTKEEKAELISITDLDEVAIDTSLSMRRMRPNPNRNARQKQKRMKNVPPTAADDHCLLTNWYNEHRSNPYPTKEEKAQLPSAMGKTLKQIRAWFRKASEDQKKTKCVPPSAADALEKWHIEHSLNPPTKEEKVELISITDLDEMTIDNWFSMRRWRPDSRKLNNTDHLKSWF